MKVLHNPSGDSRLGDLLIRNLMSRKWTSFGAAVAFLKMSGTKHVCPPLRRFARHAKVKISVGIDHRGTTVEALRDLLASLGKSGQAYVFHNEAPSTFHPKLYLFANDQGAECFIGSGNLTEGGLFTNYEVFVHVVLNRSEPNESQLLEQIENILDQWSTTATGTVRRLTPRLMSKLHMAGLVPTEDQVRETEERARSITGETSVTRKKIAKIFARVPVKRAPPAKKARRATRQRIATRAAREFVMTLQKTDAGVGQVTAGTQKRSPEIFIPLAARDANPSFWGWRSRFTEDPRKPGKWDRTGVRVRLGTEIIRVNMMTWPDKHDFRLRNATLRAAGAIGDILRIEKVQGNRNYSFFAEIARQGSSAHTRHLAECTHAVRNSPKRWGYY